MRQEHTPHVAEHYSCPPHSGERALAEIDDIRRAVDDDGVRGLRTLSVEVRPALRAKQHDVSAVRRHEALGRGGAGAQPARDRGTGNAERADAHTMLEPGATS